MCMNACTWFRRLKRQRGQHKTDRVSSRVRRVANLFVQREEHGEYVILQIRLSTLVSLCGVKAFLYIFTVVIKVPIGVTIVSRSSLIRKNMISQT